MAAAVNCFVTEPIGIMVPTDSGVLASTPALPYASSSSLSLPLNAAATMPTERLARTSAPAIESSRWRRVAVPCAGADMEAAAVRTTAVTARLKGGIGKRRRGEDQVTAKYFTAQSTLT